jgi:hypothetical protein
MVVVSYSGREINAKIVYYGPGLSGKTTNLEKIYDSVPETNRGRMVSMKTQTDRTLFFDLLPLDLGDLQGMKTRLLLYTVPGQVYYNATRKLVLKGVDAVVFVADSAPDKMAENRESLANLEMNLKAYGIDIRSIPWVLQLNKRDLPNAMAVEDMSRELNRFNVPVFEAQAANGVGVFETLRGVSKLLLAKITKDVLEKDRGSLARVQRDSASGEPGTAQEETPAAPRGSAEAKGPGGKLLKFLKRGKEEAPAPEPVTPSSMEPVIPPNAEPVIPAGPVEAAPLLADADLLEEAAPLARAEVEERRPANAEEELTLDESDLVRQEGPGGPAGEQFKRPGAGGGGAEPFTSRPRSRAVEGTAGAPVASGDVRRITVPIDLGALPATGRLTLTFEVRIQVDSAEPTGVRAPGRPESGIDETFTRDIEVLY